MNKFLLVANWKAYVPAILNFKFEILNSVEVAIAASHPFISQIPPEFTRAAQDVSAYPIGSYTGEVPAEMLANLGVKYCLVGHSERRQYLGETLTLIEKKIEQAIKNSLIPIVCAQNLEEIPANIRNYPGDKFMIMYEPFVAISTEGQYHPESPEKVAAVLTDWKNRLNLTCRLLYGGSVNPENCKLLIVNCKLLSGFVVGHASLDPISFSDIIKKCSPE